MKKFSKAIAFLLVAILLIGIGFFVGYRTTVLNGNIEIDNGNEHIGYFTVFGQTDVYYID